jgi:hypothetical protein
LIKLFKPFAEQELNITAGGLQRHYAILFEAIKSLDKKQLISIPLIVKIN